VLFKKWSDSPYPATVCVNLGNYNGYPIKMDVSVWYYGDQDAYFNTEECRDWLLAEQSCYYGGIKQHGVWWVRYVK